MRSKIVYNQEFKDKTDHYDNLFRIKLRNALEYRRIKQEQLAHLCNKKSQNAAAKWITLNESYKTSPNAPEFMAICDILELDIAYFKNEDIGCIQADLNLTEIEKLRQLNNLADTFVETSVVTQCFSLLDNQRKTSAVNVLSTVPQNGTSRALREYTAIHKNVVLTSKITSLEGIQKNIDALSLPGGEKPFLLFDNVEKAKLELLMKIIDRFSGELSYPVTLVGKNLEDRFQGTELEYQFDEIDFLGVLIFEDVFKFLEAAFPEKTEDEIMKIAPFLIGGIGEIMDYVS